MTQFLQMILFLSISVSKYMSRWGQQAWHVSYFVNSVTFTHRVWWQTLDLQVTQDHLVSFRTCRKLLIITMFELYVFHYCTIRNILMDRIFLSCVLFRPNRSDISAVYMYTHKNFGNKPSVWSPVNFLYVISCPLNFTTTWLLLLRENRQEFWNGVFCKLL